MRTHTVSVPTVFECMRLSHGSSELHGDINDKLEQQVPVHKDVLSLKSGFFREYFQTHVGSNETVIAGAVNVCTILIEYMYAKESYSFPAYGSLFLVDLFLAAEKYRVVGLSVAVAECLKEELESNYDYHNEWTPEKIMDVVEKVYSETKRPSVLRKQFIRGLAKEPEYKEMLREETVRERLANQLEFLMELAGL